MNQNPTIPGGLLTFISREHWLANVRRARLIRRLAKIRELVTRIHARHSN